MDGGKQDHGPTSPRSRDAQAFLRRRLSQSRARTAPQGLIPRTDRSGPIPQSFAQQRIWFLQDLAPGNPFYNIPAAVPLNGPIDVAALERSLNTMVARHESLRTVFGRDGDVPFQQVMPHTDMPLEMIDLSDQGLREAERQTDDLAVAEAAAPFDLATGPVIRFRLVRLAAARHVLLLTVHHIAADGWSMGVLFREFSTLYEAYQAGHAPELPDLPIQYGDFAVWQRDRLSGAPLADLLGYWRDKLEGAVDLPLITDRPRTPMASFRGAFLDLSVDQATTAGLRRLARAHDCTLFQAMLAAYKLVLARMAGAEDIVVGAPIANRAHSGLEPLIGFFVNSLALRTDLSGDPTFTELLARVRDTTVGAYAHQDLPFERLVEDLQPDRDLSRNPLFQVSFQIQNAPGVSDNPQAVGQDFRRIARSSAILDLALSLWETPKGLIGGVEYSTDLYDKATVQALMDGLQLVLKAVVADPEVRLSEAPLRTVRQEKANRRQLAGPKARYAVRDMATLFVRSVADHADRTALVDDQGTVTFADLDAQAGRIASAFLAAGIGPGDVVGLALDRGRDFTALILAITRIGAAYLPIDPAIPPLRLADMAAQADPKIVLIADNAPDYTHGASGRVGDLLAFAATCDPLDGLAPIDPEDTCYVLFTSGSTGRPKAVAVPHRALANHMQWMADAFVVTPDDRILQRTPTHFDASIWEVWLPLLTGAQLCLPAPFHAADVPALAQAMAQFTPTILQGVPSLMQHLIATGTPNCPDLRLFCLGGEPLTANLCIRIRHSFPAATIVNLYGPTETTIDATWHAVPADAQDPLPIGRPVANSSVLVLDDTGALCPPNMRGEIAIAGVPVASGYLGQDDLTASRFVTLSHGQECFLSGDVGWYDGTGTLYCAGRRDRQVKLRGNRIELPEIEAVLAEHPVVGQAAVLLHAGDQPSLAGFVTLAAGSETDALRAEIATAAVDEWEDLYRVVYAPSADIPEDATTDFTGWTSSFDGAPIPTDQMRDWADETASRIAALDPSGVFEIGVGSGLILSRIASDDMAYVGCDLSAPVIARLQDWVDRTQTGAVALHVAKAEDAHALDVTGCDTLVMNSVVQYLPGAGQLRKVLAQNAARMSADVRLFIGDVRPFGLLRAFHTGVEVSRAAADVAAPELRKRIETAIAQDKELLLAPAFFRQIGDDLPADVAVRLKLGAAGNELFDYRYDVVLRCGAPRPPAPLNWRVWRSDPMDMAALEAEMTAGQTIALSGVPNARVVEVVALSHLIRDSGCDLDRSALLAAASDSAAQGLHPGTVSALAATHGLRAEALPSRDHADAFDLVIHDGALDAYNIDAVQPGRDPGGRPVATEPTLRALTTRLAPVLEDHMAQHLPPAMRPTRLMVLDDLPMLANGKLDTAALIDQLPHEPVRATQFAVPADPLEKLIADIFAAVLGVRQVGAEDHFFKVLGGHSLLATQAVARLREIFGDVPLRLLFEHPTPAALAVALAAEDPDALDIAAEYAAMQDMDEAALDALLDTAKGPDHE